MANVSVRKRILLVDDEAGIRLTLPRVLTKYGFEVISVTSVEDALGEIQTAEFDVLLSDLNIPQSNEGFLVIEAMRRSQPRCLNFILTGYPEAASAARAAKHGVAHYFTKPVDIDELVRLLREKLSAKRHA